MIKCIVYTEIPFLLIVPNFNIAENRINFPQSFSFYPDMKDDVTYISYSATCLPVCCH